MDEMHFPKTDEKVKELEHLHESLFCDFSEKGGLVRKKNGSTTFDIFTLYDQSELVYSASVE